MVETVGSGERPQGMYLSRLWVKNLRSCRSTEVALRPAMTVILGENNSGKSNIIDALRLSTSPLNGRRTRFFESDDFSWESLDQPITVTSQFAGLTSLQHGPFYAGISLKDETLWHTVKVRPPEHGKRLKVEYLVAPVPVRDPEPEARARITHVYLEPLRDAQRELDSPSGNRLNQIIKYLHEEQQQVDFVDLANSGLRELEKHPVVSGTTQNLQKHLDSLTRPTRHQAVKLGFADYRLNKLARGLRLKMAEFGLEVSDIENSGLGYANILYLATIILELRNAEDSELTVFLVEEPEAHLHPQMQIVLLEYLREQAENSMRSDVKSPAGRIQVVATTHSPNIASTAGIDNVVVTGTGTQNLNGGLGVSTTTTLALAELGLTSIEKRKIDRYLDATRSELLFTKCAILVEGIAEAVLLPSLAAKCVFPSDSAEDVLRRRALHATSIIIVGSVDFNPYVKLLLQEVNGVRLAHRVVIVTDGDPTLDEIGEPAAQPLHDRTSRLLALAEELGARDKLFVESSRYTLEADLIAPIESNGELIRAAFLAQKPASEDTWRAIASASEPDKELYKRLRQNSRFLAKGEFAHEISSLLKSGYKLNCPPYLSRAICRAVEDERLSGQAEP